MQNNNNYYFEQRNQEFKKKKGFDSSGYVAQIKNFLSEVKNAPNKEEIPKILGGTITQLAKTFSYVNKKDQKLEKSKIKFFEEFMMKKKGVTAFEKLIKKNKNPDLSEEEIEQLGVKLPYISIILTKFINYVFEKSREYNENDEDVYKNYKNYYDIYFNIREKILKKCIKKSINSGVDPRLIREAYIYIPSPDVLGKNYRYELGDLMRNWYRLIRIKDPSSDLQSGPIAIPTHKELNKFFVNHLFNSTSKEPLYKLPKYLSVATEILLTFHKDNVISSSGRDVPDDNPRQREMYNLLTNWALAAIENTSRQNQMAVITMYCDRRRFDRDKAMKKNKNNKGLEPRRVRWDEQITKESYPKLYKTIKKSKTESKKEYKKIVAPYIYN